jgi:hypothetical protein
MTVDAGSPRTFRRRVASTYEDTARLDTRALALELSTWTVGAVVLFKTFLGNPVKCERGHGALQTGSGNAPRAVGAAPAGEVVAVDPDQTFVHTSTCCLAWW